MKTIKRRAFCRWQQLPWQACWPRTRRQRKLPQAVVGSAVPEDYYSFAFRSDHSETDLSTILLYRCLF